MKFWSFVRSLAFLALFALLDGLVAGFGATLYAEYLLLVVLIGLVAAHGVYFGRRLRGLAEAFHPYLPPLPRQGATGG